ncbi:rhodanese-like domain-containing protein [Hyphococcus flavus]|uniref:Rhodanese-like domain-containing protein n=1 Tax=Hyphococcus flavus TaxID=1866326 RepID=A0AAE9ZAZ6_9PROT|nr:rhodanese-like domain-containing protein [Hyphococcus flavus]WDI31149.1 rhodanese-like domain-containing protein [Hyphococcus flavus]
MRSIIALLAACSLIATPPAFAQDSFGGKPTKQNTQPAPVQNQQGDNRVQSQQPNVSQPQQNVTNKAAPHSDPQSAAELQDYGVAATNQLHTGAMHGPTPASIPGGQVITTKGVAELMQGGQTPYLVLDILGGQEIIPGAVFAVPAHQPGNFNDQTQNEFSRFLMQMTGGNKEVPLILYCQSTQCWMSYNAALRAINMGYTNVLWYRGGIEAWKAAGHQTTYPQ